MSLIKSPWDGESPLEPGSPTWEAVPEAPQVTRYLLYFWDVAILGLTHATMKG
jgi:hypothetical protein